MRVSCGRAAAGGGGGPLVLHPKAYRDVEQVAVRPVVAVAMAVIVTVAVAVGVRGAKATLGRAGRPRQRPPCDQASGEAHHLRRTWARVPALCQRSTRASEDEGRRQSVGCLEVENEKSTPNVPPPEKNGSGQAHRNATPTAGCA